MAEEPAADQEKKSWSKAAFEDIVITAAVVVGIVFGGIMSMLHTVPPIIVAIFLGMGISCLVYRFLGGITQDNSFAIKGMKLTGTAAVWIICALIIDPKLTDQRNTRIWEEESLTLYVKNENNRSMPNVSVFAGLEEREISADTGAVGKFSIPFEFLSGNGTIYIIPETDLAREEQDPRYDPNANELRLQYDIEKPSITVRVDKK